MKGKAIFAALLAAAWLVAGAAQVSAQAVRPILLGSTGRGGVSSILYEIDPATGDTLREIGPVGYRLNGMAWDPTSRTLYGTTSVTDPNYTGLISLDINTGAGTPVGTDDYGLEPGDGITNLSINSSGELFAWWEMGDVLLSIDPDTGLATPFADPEVGTSEHGMAFDNFDILWLVNRTSGDIYTVDTTTGEVTSEGSISKNAHHGTFDLDPASNLYYGLNNLHGAGPELVKVDVYSASIVETLPVDPGMHVLEFVDSLVCDIFPDDRFTRNDLIFFVLGCAFGRANWVCDLSGNGGLDTNDLIGYLLTCR